MIHSPALIQLLMSRIALGYLLEMTPMATSLAHLPFMGPNVKAYLIRNQEVGGSNPPIAERLCSSVGRALCLYTNSPHPFEEY